MLYTSINNNRVKDIKKLNTKKYRDETNLFLIEGEHLVNEAHKKGLLRTLIKEENSSFNLDVETIEVSTNVLKFISELETPQPVMGICRKKKEEQIGDIILILDDIQDPGNLGTIIRSAVAFNVDTIVLSRNTVDLYNSKVIRASQGMLFNINILVEELNTFSTFLKERNYKIIGTSVKDGKALKTLEKIDKVAIIMGNEGNGVRKNLLDMSDELIYIKMNENCESLNVAIATSIILYELDK